MIRNSGEDSPGSLLLQSFQTLNKERIDNFEPDVEHIFSSSVSYERGRYLCEKYLQGLRGSSNNIEDQIKQIPTRNILLISLIDYIPEGVDIYKTIHLSYQGITIPVIDGKRSKAIKFKNDIHLFLLSFDKVVTTDLSQEMDRMNYFVSFLKNTNMEQSLKAFLKRKDIRKISGNTTVTYDDISNILHPDTESPLLSFINEGDLDEACGGINTRKFLAFMLDISEDIIADWTHIFFHDSGIYYVSSRDSNIGFIPATVKYISYFDIKETTDQFHLDVKKGISRGDKMWEFGKRIPAIVAKVLDKEYTRAIKKHTDNVPPIDVFINQMREDYGVPISTENILRYEVFGDPKKLQKLISVLSDISPIVRNFFQNGILFGEDPTYRKDASLKDIGISFKRDQSRFLSPSYMGNYLSGKQAHDGSDTSFHIYTHEIEYLQKYEQFYPFFMYLFLGRVFRKLLHLASENPEYKALLKDIEGLLEQRLDLELQALSQNGFDKKTALAKNSVYINYFMRYGCAYIMEKQGKPLQTTIPEAWRVFLRDKIFMDYERLN